MKAARGVVALAAVAMAAQAGAGEVVLKHDPFSDNINQAGADVTGKTLQIEPGFVMGEAFGALFRPPGENFPLKILSVDVLFGGPSDLSTALDIEIYLDAGEGPAPANPTPDFVVNTGDFFNPETNDLGIPVKGSMGYTFVFNYEDKDGAPPLVTKGNILVMMRYTKPAMDMMAQYGVLDCMLSLGIGACGCQPAAMILDGTLTSKSNVMHIVTPLGQCSGGTSWFWFEELKVGDKKLGGDVILRLRVDTAGAVCTPVCSEKDCGPDGCGGICGSCSEEHFCKNGQCTPCGCDDKECGDDGCGNSCGACSDEAVCQAGKCKGGTICGCSGKECGPDGCGTSCGTCDPGEKCKSGQCEKDAECVSNCTGKVCGDDGCGGGCAPGCAAGQTCDGGSCAGGVAQELTVSSISPKSQPQGESTHVSISGTGFLAGAKVKLGGTDLSPVEVVSNTLIASVVPESLNAGVYSVFVVNPDGNVGTLPDAFQVTEPEAKCGDGLCQLLEGEECRTCPADCGPCAESAEGCSTGGSPASGAALPAVLLLLLCIAAIVSAAGVCAGPRG